MSVQSLSSFCSCLLTGRSADSTVPRLLFCEVAKVIPQGDHTPFPLSFLLHSTGFRSLPPVVPPFPQAGGGIFSDLSWLHLRPISSNIFTGYHQTTHCSIPESEEDVLLPPLTSLEDPTFEDINQSFRSCYTSSLLVFRSTIHNLETKPKPNSPSAPSVQSPVPSQMILQCMLAKYDQENGALRRCLHLEPLLTGGALCVQVNSFLSASLSPLGLNSVCG
jgi:hypothetical protein